MRVRLRIAALALASGVAGCGVGKRSPEASLPSSAAAEARARIEVRTPDERPKIVLVEREGDPQAAVAVAIAHDFGSAASAALSGLLEARLAARGFPAAETRAHAMGFQLAALAKSPEQAALFVRALDQALRTEVQASDPALVALKRRFDALKARSWPSAAEAAVGACSGELGIPLGSPLIDVATEAGARQVEAWRRSVASARSVAIGVLGPPAVLDAASDAVDDTQPWPLADPPSDPWPPADVVGSSAQVSGPRRLSVALRVASPAAAISAARALAASGASIAQRLQVLDPPWSLERVVGSTRPRGGCVRLDLVGPKGDPGPELVDVARVSALALDEARQVVSHVPNAGWVLDDSVLRPHDPREAASIAAWRTLIGTQEPGPTRRFVSYVTSPSELRSGTDADLARLLSRAENGAAATVELRGRLEAGQGELWALLGTPCGTIAETSGDAGLTALVVRAIAEKRSRVGDVAIEPWFTPDGIGLLAHAPRLGPAETAAAHAERIGSALGQVLLGTRLTGADVAQTRMQVLTELGGPRPGWRQLLDALAPDHPAWLDARGTWQSVSSLVGHNVEARRRSLALGPLRLAVLSNSDEGQSRTVALALERWIRPLRDEQRGCATAQRPPARAGEQRLETTADVGVSAYIAASLPPSLTTTGREAEWAAYLMNRPGGWLDHALKTPGLASAAEAIVLGGSQASALVVAVSSMPDQTDAAVAQVRAVLQRLADGAVTEQDMASARRHFDREDLALQLNPRRRIVDLWRASRSATPPDLASLRRFLRALRADAHVVVRLIRKD